MNETLSQILKDCPNKSEIIGAIGKLNHLDEFSTALRKYLNDRAAEKQKLTTLYQQCMQNKFKVENECSGLKNGLAEKEKLLEDQKLHIETLKNDLTNATDKIDTIKLEFEKKYDINYTTLQQEYDSLKSTNNLLIGEKNELLGIINRKDVHIQQLDEQWKENVEKLRKANATKSELQAKLDEYTQNGTLNEWKKKLATQQSEIYENTIKQHLDTISSQSNELIKLKKINHELSASIQTVENQKTTEISHLNGTVDTLRKHVESLQDNYKKLIDKATHNESLMNMEKLELEKELNSSNRLRELLSEDKNHLTDTINRHREIQNELVTKVNQLEKENTELMTSFNENSKLWNDNVERYESKIKCLEDELAVVETIVESSRVDDTSCLTGASYDPLLPPQKSLLYSNDSTVNRLLSPMAQTTSQLLKKGLTITQIYANYNKALNTIEELRDDISKMSLRFGSTTKRLEDQKTDYELLNEEKNRCELYADHLSKNLIEANTTIGELEARVSSFELENADLLEQKLALTQLTQDLSNQIRHLLRSNDLDSNDSTNFNDMVDQLDFDEMESDSLVNQVDAIVESSLIFKTVEQLQSQNIKLLALCRNLKKKSELLITDPKTKEEYEKRLGEANNKITIMSNQLETTQKSYETTKKQLDIFMAANKSGPPFKMESTVIPSIGETVLDEASGGYNNSVDIDSKKSTRSFETIREQYNQMITSKVELLNEARLEISRLNDHSGYLQSRISQLENQVNQIDEQRAHAVSNLQHEIKQYRLKEEKFIQVDLLNKQLKENALFYRSNCDELTEKLNHLEQLHRTLSDENSHLRESSKFLEAQLQTQTSQSNNYGQLLSCIQDIQNNLEYRENSSGIKMKNFIDEMKDEVKTLRFQLKEAQENNDIRYHTDIQNLRIELKAKEDTISKLLNSENELRDKLIEVKKEISASTLEKPPQAPADNNNDPNETIQKLTEQLNNYKKQVEQLLVVSAAAEENLEKNVSVWNECKQNLEKEVDKMRSIISEKVTEIEQQAAQVTNLEQQLNEKQSTITRYENQQNAKVEPLLTEIETMKQRENIWNENKQQLNGMLKQLREKYEMELIAHADDISSLKENNRKCEEMAKRSHQYEHEIRSLKQKLGSLQCEYDVKLESYEISNNDRMLQLKSAMEQNNILSSHIESLIKQIAALKETNSHALTTSTILTGSSGGGGTDAAIGNLSDNLNDQKVINTSIESGGGVEELWELIKFLRRDKDILETRLESQKAEAFKYRIKCERLEKGCQNLEASLIAERSVLNDSSAVVDQAMKINDLELINSQLKQKIADYEIKCTEIEERLQTVKCEVGNLKKQLSVSNLQSESTSNELTEIKRQLSYSENVCSSLRSQLANMNKSNAELNAKLSSLRSKDSNDKTKADMFNERISNLSIEIQSYKNKINELSADKLKALTEKEEEIKSLKNDQTMLKEKLTSLEDDLRKSISRNHSLHSIATHLKNEVNTAKLNRDTTESNPTSSNVSASTTPTTNSRPQATSEEYIKMDKNLHESQTKNTLLEEEVRRLKQKLHLIQQTKKQQSSKLSVTHNVENPLHSNIPVEDYHKLSNAHEALKQRFDVLTKHMTEMNRNQDSIVKKNNTTFSKPIPFGSTPIHRRISDGPVALVTGSTDSQQQQRSAINRISPPRPEGKTNSTLPTTPPPSNNEVASLPAELAKPSLSGEVSSDVLSDESEFLKNNNSSTPADKNATSNSSNLPSVFSEIKPPGDHDDSNYIDCRSQAVQSSLFIDSKGISVKKSLITHPSPINRSVLKRSLVRHKTPILKTTPYNLRSSVESNETTSVHDSIQNNCSQVESPLAVYPDNSDKSSLPHSSISSHDDSNFKRPQKRMAVSESRLSHGNIIIDDSADFEAKRSNIPLPDKQESFDIVQPRTASSSALSDLQTPSALFDTPVKLFQVPDTRITKDDSTYQNPNKSPTLTDGNASSGIVPHDSSTRSLKLRRSSFSRDPPTSGTLPNNTQTILFSNLDTTSTKTEEEEGELASSSDNSNDGSPSRHQSEEEKQ